MGHRDQRPETRDQRTLCLKRFYFLFSILWFRRGRGASPGFTLMEIVVAMFIFMLASVIIADIFVNVQRAQARLRASQTASTNARYLLDVLAREIRADTVDYAGYAGNTVPSRIDESSELKLLTGERKSVVFRLRRDSVNCPAAAGSSVAIGCVQISRDGALFSTITAPTLSVEQLIFFVTPLGDPFSSNGAVCGGAIIPPNCSPDVQPQVTIALSLSTVDAKVDNRVSSYLQTTVTSRAYVR